MTTSGDTQKKSKNEKNARIKKEGNLPRVTIYQKGFYFFQDFFL
jgi:hypothetical protein